MKFTRKSEDSEMNSLINELSALLPLQDMKNTTMKVTVNGTPIVDVENGVNKLAEKPEEVKKDPREGDTNFMVTPKKFLTPFGIAHYDDEFTKDKDYVYIPVGDLRGIMDYGCAGEKGEKGCPCKEPVNDTPEAEDKPKLQEIEYAEAPKSEPVIDDEFGPGERFSTVTDRVTKDDFDETYLIRETVKGNSTVDEQSITFDFTGDDGITTPGINDVDLAWILLYRNRDNEERANLIMKLIKTF